MRLRDLHTERTAPGGRGGGGNTVGGGTGAAIVAPRCVPLCPGRGAAVHTREKGEGRLRGPPPHKGRSEECGGGERAAGKYSVLPTFGRPRGPHPPQERRPDAVPGPGARPPLALQFLWWSLEGARDRGGLPFQNNYLINLFIFRKSQGVH